MRQAHFARLHPEPAAGERRHRGRMVRAAERARPRQPPALQRARHRSDHRHLQRLGGIERRQDARQAGGEQRLARARRPAHQQVMPARRRNLERASRRLLPLHLGEIGPRHALVDHAGRGRGQQLVALEMVEQRDEVGCGDHVHLPRPARLRPLRGGTDQSLARLGGVERSEQHARARRDPPVQRQLADHDIAGQRLCIDHAHCSEQRQRHRQVEMRAFHVLPKTYHILVPRAFGLLTSAILLASAGA